MTTATTRSVGFTLVEMMITLFIFSILLTMAVPSFQSFIANQRVKTDANNLLVALMYARSEAIKRNATINVMPASGDWSQGWCVFLNTVAAPECPYTGTIDAVDAPLRQQDASNSIVIDTDAVMVTFGPTGRITGNAITINLCDTNNLAFERQMTIGLTGSAVIKQGNLCGS